MCNPLTSQHCWNPYHQPSLLQLYVIEATLDRSTVHIIGGRNGNNRGIAMTLKVAMTIHLQSVINEITQKNVMKRNVFFLIFLGLM